MTKLETNKKSGEGGEQQPCQGIHKMLLAVTHEFPMVFSRTTMATELTEGHHLCLAVLLTTSQFLDWLINDSHISIKKLEVVPRLFSSFPYYSSPQEN